MVGCGSGEGAGDVSGVIVNDISVSGDSDPDGDTDCFLLFLVLDGHLSSPPIVLVLVTLPSWTRHLNLTDLPTGPTSGVDIVVGNPADANIAPVDGSKSNDWGGRRHFREPLETWDPTAKTSSAVRLRFVASLLINSNGSPCLGLIDFEFEIGDFEPDILWTVIARGEDDIRSSALSIKHCNVDTLSICRASYEQHKASSKSEKTLY